MRSAQAFIVFKNYLFVVILLFSFGFHAIQIDHEHLATIHHEHKEAPLNLEVVMHATDKKIFVDVVAGMLLAVIFLCQREMILGLLLFAMHAMKNASKRYGINFRKYDYFIKYLSRGIFHTKVYS